MEKRKAPFKVSEAESSEAFVKSSEHSQNETLGLVAIPEAQDEKSLPGTLASTASIPLDPIELDDPDFAPAPAKGVIPIHHGLTRHNAIVGGCLLVAALSFALCSYDFSSLIQRAATLDRGGALIYQAPSPNLPLGIQYGRISSESEGLRVIQTTSLPRLEGFVDPSGKIVIEPKFQRLGSFHEGLASASESGSNGFIDKTGRFVIAEKFAQVENFHSGTAVVSHDGRWGVIDKLGKLISDSFDAEPVRDGDLFIVKQHGRFGLISNSGETLLAPTYESIEPSDGSIFKEGGAGRLENLRPSANFEFRSGGLSGVITRKGTVVLEPKYDSVASYSYGFAVVGKAGHAKLIDPFGNTLAQYSDLTNWDKLIAAKENGKWIFLNEKGEKLPLAPVDSVVLSPNGKWFSNGLAPVRLNGKWGFVDWKGRFAIQPQFEFVTGFDHGVCPVWDGTAWRLIDRSGAYLPLPKLGNISREDDGLLHVDVAGPLYTVGKTETISGTRIRIDGLHTGLMAGLTLDSAFQNMKTITHKSWNPYDSDY